MPDIDPFRFGERTMSGHANDEVFTRIAVGVYDIG